MATVNPAQQTADDIRRLQARIGDLQSHVRLSDAQNEVNDLNNMVTGFPQRLFALRASGYVFEKGLESQSQALVASWGLLFPNLQAQISSQSVLLINALRPIEMQMPQLTALASNPGVASGLLNTLTSSVSMLEDKINAAAKVIDGMYDQFNSQASQFTHHLDEVDFMLTQVAEAKFQLLSAEAGIAAVKAVWCKTGKEQKDDPQGILYLSDQRLIFEQKEEIVTKKVLFVATEKQKVQQLLLECPVALVENVDAEKRGLMKNEDHIELRFSSAAPVESAHFHIWQEGSGWQALINRVKSKAFDGDRVIPIDQATVDKIKAAPAQCPSCGGNINQTILRGQDKITCEYCGFVIRL